MSPPATVLLVDEDRDSLAIYSMILEHHGFHVLRAPTEDDGFRAACEDDPDLVVTELFVLHRPPRECLAERLRGDPRTAHLPLVALSTVALLSDHPALRVCDSYLSKPCVPSRLLREVQRLLPGPAALC